MSPKEPNNDTDADFDPAEIDAAAQEMVDPGVDPAPEESPQLVGVTTWDQAPATSGRATPKFPLDPEQTVAEELVQDGLESADRDQRLAAADPDYEP